MKLTFIIADTWRTTLAVIHENESRPYRRRTVTIELTPEQQEAVRVREVGSDGDKPKFEEILDVLIENEDPGK